MSLQDVTSLGHTTSSGISTLYSQCYYKDSEGLMGPALHAASCLDSLKLKDGVPVWKM